MPYHSAYDDSNSDSVAGENQPYKDKKGSDGPIHAYEITLFITYVTWEWKS